MKYLLAHDIGTSGNKAALFNIDGVLIESKTFSYDVEWTHDGFAEQDANIWYKSVCVLTKDLLKHIDASDVIGISFSGQMQGCLVVDRNGNPLHKSIIWADIRARREEKLILSVFDKMSFYKITGNRPSCSYTLAKLLWLKHNKPDIYEETYRVLNAKDYIIYKLTGNFVTDYSDASSTNLLDLRKMEWSEEIADKMGVSLNKFPSIHYSTDVVGKITEKASQETGLGTDTSVVCGGGDGAISAIGAMSISEGDAFGTIGTSAWNAITSKKPIFDEEMKTFVFAHAIPDHFIRLGTMQTAGAAMNWLKKSFFIDKNKDIDDTGADSDIYDEMEQLVKQAQVGSKGLLFLPYLMGERSPRWNRDAKASFIGLTVETSRADICRSVYEGIAMNLEIILNSIRKGNRIKKFVLTGGAARSNLLCQLLSDVYGLSISIPNCLEEATSVGAAVCAGVGIGEYKSFEKIHDFIKIDHTIEALEENTLVYEKLKPIFDQAYFKLEDIFTQINIFNQDV